MIISNQLSVIRNFVEKVESLRLFSMSLKLLISLLFFFLSTATHATPESLSSSNKKSQRSTNVASEDSSKHWVKAQPSKLAFFERHAEGWHWYDTLRVESLRDGNQLSVNSNQKEKEKEEKTQTPTQMIEEQRKKLEQKLHAAIVEPTREKIIAYIMAQKTLMDQSQRFSESWQRVVMTTPSLDETLIHPIDQNARHIYYQERHQEITKRIKALAQDYGLFFFFKGTCTYCHYFAPVVKHFAKKHGWSVLGISMDGGSLPAFPHAKRDNGMAARLQVSHVPALIAYHPKSGEMIPLAYGLVSESEIEERVILLSSPSTNPPSSNSTTRGEVTHDGVTYDNAIYGGATYDGVKK